MHKIKRSDIQFLDALFEKPGNPGYVLNFNDRTFAEYFEDEFNIDIDDEKYRQKGTSKLNRLRTFIEIENSHTVAKVLRSLWEYRDAVYGPFAQQDIKVIGDKKRFFDLVHAIKNGSDIAPTDSIDKFAQDETLEELVAAIQRDIQANKPQVALDRLHTYCMKKFAHLLKQRGLTIDKDEPLHSRAGKYIKSVEAAGNLQSITIKIMKSSISIFDSFNSTRNNASLAHDNELVEKHEARFIFDSIVSILRFLKNIETSKFGE